MSSTQRWFFFGVPLAGLFSLLGCQQTTYGRALQAEKQPSSSSPTPSSGKVQPPLQQLGSQGGTGGSGPVTHAGAGDPRIRALAGPPPAPAPPAQEPESASNRTGTR